MQNIDYKAYKFHKKVVVFIDGLFFATFGIVILKI